MPSQEVLSALDTLHREIEKLEPAIRHVESAQEVTRIVGGIPAKHLELLNALREADVEHKSELLSAFRGELSSLTNENVVLQRVTGSMQAQVQSELTELAALRDRVSAFYERIEKINFPERLDKLDASVAGLMAATQAIQSRLDGLERNLSDRISGLHDFEKETRNLVLAGLQENNTTLKTGFEKSGKRQQIQHVVTWVLLLIALVVIFVTKA
jgi:chromosome segregation ATPase